jgi:hypothetical protein
MKTQDETRLILSSIRSLLGSITPALRSVSVEFKDNTILWQSIFDENATSDDFELMNEATSELIADFPNAGLKETIKKIPHPKKIKHLSNLIYLRHE